MRTSYRIVPHATSLQDGVFAVRDGDDGGKNPNAECRNPKEHRSPNSDEVSPCRFGFRM